MNNKVEIRSFPSALEDVKAAELCVPSPQTLSPSYRLAYADQEFLLRDELRPVRLQLELLKPELILRDHGIEHTIVIFGGARVVDPETAKEHLASVEAELKRDPENESLVQKVKIARSLLEKSKYYEEARKLAFLISKNQKRPGHPNLVVITGGGPGIMEAANRGAQEAGAESIGLNIVLPYEQRPNPYITPDLCFQFHYFAIRKMHFLLRARGLVVFPGGYGTLDELFETLTLIQTKKIKPIPVLIFGRPFWERVIHFEALVEEGTISPEDTQLFQFVETAEEAWEILSKTFSQSSMPSQY